MMGSDVDETKWIDDRDQAPTANLDRQEVDASMDQSSPPRGHEVKSRDQVQTQAGEKKRGMMSGPSP